MVSSNRGWVVTALGQKPKTVLLVLSLVIASFFVPSGPAQARRAEIIVDADTGAVLYQYRANKRHYPASLTKLMTLYLLFEALDEGRVSLDTRFTASARAAGQPKSKLGLRKGQKITVNDAILALVIKSANDVATVVAEALGGEEWRFAAQMTNKARELGMRRTRFRNATGLPNRRQVSTAADMALLARVLYRDFPYYYHYFGTQYFKFNGKIYSNHNRLVGSYAGVDGLKTGYIRASGFNLVISAERGGRRLVGVVLGERTPKARDRRMTRLLDRGFSAVRQVAAAPPPPGEKPAADVSAPWAIQVGAYAEIGGAYAALKASTKHIPSIVASAAAVVVPVEEGDGGLYRARFVGISRASARRACGILTRRKLTCEVVRHLPGTDTVAAAN